MTIAITLLLASLLIIGILRTVRESRGESPAEQVTESTAKAEEISEPQAEIIIENPPYQAEEKKAAPAKKVTVKKAPAKKVPAKKTTTKK
jgi:tRNA1(Val) A37 N6-methylase TrmN6